MSAGGPGSEVVGTKCFKMQERREVYVTAGCYVLLINEAVDG